ncbi:hypothetical protein OG943_24995 [Amycolatopsis sp. NBC_00345]|uniref:hypothetical protein n=1 Tax=Amycolatopsis sp. NBC_00345 TaxID=2975955 RepID=UPI002E270EAD
MTTLILDRSTGALPPYRDWLWDAEDDLVLFTGRAEPGADGFAEVRTFPDYATAGTVEQAALTLPVTAVVALSPADAVRAGALRDHLGLPGPGRAAAIACVDLLTQRGLLSRAGVPTVACGPVDRAADLFWYAHRWGYPLRVRSRRAEGWPTVARLGSEAEIAAFTAAAFSPDLRYAPDLLAEAGAPAQTVRYTLADVATAAPAAASAVRAAFAALTEPGGPPVAEVAGSDDGVLVDAVDTWARDGARAAARGQAGLPTEDQEATG